MVADMSRTIYHKKGEKRSNGKKILKDSEVSAENLFNLLGGK